MKGHGERFDDDIPERKGKKDKKFKPRRVKRVDSQVFGSEVDEVEVHLGSRLSDIGEEASRGDAVKNSPTPEAETPKANEAKGGELAKINFAEEKVAGMTDREVTEGLNSIVRGRIKNPGMKLNYVQEELMRKHADGLKEEEERIEELKERARALARKDASGKKEKMTKEEKLEEEELRSKDKIFQVAYKEEMNKLADEKANDKPSEKDGLDPEIVAEQKKNLMSAMRGGKPSIDKVKELGLWVERQAKRGFLGNKKKEVRAAYREIVDEVSAVVEGKGKTETEEIAHSHHEGVDESSKPGYNANVENRNGELTEKNIARLEQKLLEATKSLEELKALHAENIDLKNLRLQRSKLRG